MATTVGELKKILDSVSDDKVLLVERLDINGEPVRKGDRCFHVDRTEELKTTFALGIHL